MQRAYTDAYGRLRGPWLGLAYTGLALGWAATAGGLALLCAFTI